MLDKNLKSLMIVAQSIDYKNMTKNDLANEYIKADTETDRDIYLSALIIKYWYMIPLIYKKCFMLKISYEDSYEVLVDSILKALSKGGWVENKNTPERYINLCITNSVKRLFLDASRQKHIQETNLISVDAINEDNENTFELEDLNNFSNTYTSSRCITDVIQRLFKNGEINKALLLDGIAFRADCFVKKDVYNKDLKIHTQTLQFNNKKLLMYFNSLDKNKIKEIFKIYNYKSRKCSINRLETFEYKYLFEEVKKEIYGLHI